MTTASAGVAVVATQLAQTDRRALSQAWYSALHLAHDAPVVRPPRVHAPSAARGATTGAAHAAGHRPARTPDGAAAPNRAPHVAHGQPVRERRCDPSSPARRIERAVARLRAVAPAPNAQTVTLAGGRVRLLVRCDGGATRIVAICPPALRETVERALAHARFSLVAGRA